VRFRVRLVRRLPPYLPFIVLAAAVVVATIHVKWYW